VNKQVDPVEQHAIAGLRRLVPARPGNEQIVDLLRSAIVEGGLEPGALYSVREIAEALGVSRTPVREAFLQLARDNTVRFERNRGVRIIEMSQRDLAEIFELRECLEVPAAARAAERRTAAQLASMEASLAAMQHAVEEDDEATLWHHDRRFHDAVLRASGNTRLALYVDGLRDVVLRRDSTTVRQGRAPTAILAEHLPIFEAIARRDGPAAAAAMANHLQATRRILLESSQLAAEA
jgi:DNA-binding GntR family transcriptional regulator